MSKHPRHHCTLTDSTMGMRLPLDSRQLTPNLPDFLALLKHTLTDSTMAIRSPWDQVDPTSGISAYTTSPSSDCGRQGGFGRGERVRVESDASSLVPCGCLVWVGATTLLPSCEEGRSRVGVGTLELAGERHVQEEGRIRPPRRAPSKTRTSGTAYLSTPCWHLRVVGDADGCNVAIHLHPLVVLRVLQAIHHCRVGGK